MGRQVVTGRYRLISELGRGGMGRVWRAHDETLGRDVALKQLAPPDGLDVQTHADLHTRFRNEARTAGRLQHPGIVAIHDIVDDGDLWIVMQLVEGRSLHDAIRTDGPLPPDDVARIGLALVGALDAAHTQGVIHRDVTPRNVLLARNGDVVLGDFGIAAAADVTGVTQDGAVVGTPGYMAPERLHGHRATEKSDLWALGATLYQAIEADRPFRATEPGAVVAAVLTGTVTPPTRAGWLAPLLLDLLGTDPHQRPDAAAVRRRLTSGYASTGPTEVAATEPTTPSCDSLPPTVEDQPRTGSDNPGGDTLIEDRTARVGDALLRWLASARHAFGSAASRGRSDPGPPSSPPARAVFRRSRTKALGPLTVCLLILSIAVGSIYLVFDDTPDGGCNEDNHPANTRSTWSCDHGRMTFLGAGAAGVGVLGSLGGGMGLLSSLWALSVSKRPTLTIDDRGIDYREGSKASRRRVDPQLPWYVLREATVVDSYLDAPHTTNPVAGRPVEGRKTSHSVVVVVPDGHGVGARLRHTVHNPDLGGHILCRLKELGAAKPAKVKGAIDAHTSYRRALGLHSVTLEASGPNKIAVTNALQAVADINWKLAKHLVESTPKRVLQRVTPHEAEAAKAALEQAGATVTIVTT